MINSQIPDQLAPLRAAVQRQDNLVRDLKAQGAAGTDIKKAIDELNLRKKLLSTTGVVSQKIKTDFALAGDLPPKYRGLLMAAEEFIKIKKSNSALYAGITGKQHFKSSYTFIYKKFKTIFDSTKCVEEKFEKQHVVIRTDILSAYKNDTSLVIKREIYAREMTKYGEKNFEVYAVDASPSVDSTGCSIFNVFNDQRFLFKIPQRTSAMYAELAAIYKALQIAIEDRKKKIAIFTDSLSACMSLNSEETDNYIVADFHNLYKDSVVDECHIIWIPNHKGIHCNEEADYLAKNAAVVGAPLMISLTSNEAIRQIYAKLKNEWHNEFKVMCNLKHS